jgi:hypothetical protein
MATGSMTVTGRVSETLNQLESGDVKNSTKLMQNLIGWRSTVLPRSNQRKNYEHANG